MQTGAQKLTAPFYAMNTIKYICQTRKWTFLYFFFGKISFCKKDQYIIEQ